MLLLLYHAGKELYNSLKFMFLWYGMAYLNDYYNSAEVVFLSSAIGEGGLDCCQE